MTTTYTWHVYDCLNEASLGAWEDISAAEEFMTDNQSDKDIWAIMHDLEVTLSVSN